MRRFVPFLCLSALFLLIAGCAENPAVGTWNGGLGRVKATMVLQKDGTGTLNAAPLLNDASVKWKNDEKEKTTVALTVTGTMRGKSGTNTVNGTLSDDGKTMTIPFGPAAISFTKETKK